MYRKNRKIIATLLVAIAAVIAFGGCSTTPDAAPAAQTKQEAPVEKPSLAGNWNADGFLAVIGDDAIEVNIVSPDSKSLYWKGTFPVGETDKIVSKADTEALSMSILGSQDPEKTFTVLGDNEIIFEISMMGTTSIIHLKR